MTCRSSFSPHFRLVLRIERVRWRRMRRASHEGLNPTTARNYYPAQLKEAAILCENVLTNPSNWHEEINRAAVSMILGVVYDKPSLKSCHDPAIAQVNDFIGRIVRAAYPGSHYAEYFRWMKVCFSSPVRSFICQCLATVPSCFDRQMEA
jgi:hypothetical protein